VFGGGHTFLVSSCLYSARAHKRKQSHAATNMNLACVVKASYTCILLTEAPMRWLIRMLLFWAITAPLFYLFGLPYLIDSLSNKAQTQGYAQCLAQLKNDGTAGGLNSPLTDFQGEKYCHCVSDRLIFTKNDVLDAVQKKPPAALNALAQSFADGCNAELKKMMGLTPATPATAQDEMTPL
jgi:hypothetical protein